MIFKCSGNLIFYSGSWIATQMQLHFRLSLPLQSYSVGWSSPEVSALSSEMRTSLPCIGLAKKFLQFLTKNKRHFSFSPRTLLNNIFTSLFHYLLPFFRQLHNSIFPKLFYLFEQRTVPGDFYSLLGNWNFFHEKNFVKTKINGNPKLQCLVNMVDESELPSQAVTVIAWSSWNMQSCVILMEVYGFSVD